MNSPETDGAEPPDGFRYLGNFDTFEANRLLQRFTEAGIRFQISRSANREFSTGGCVSGPGYVTKDAIEIFVHKNDTPAVAKIVTANWKL